MNIWIQINIYIYICLLSFILKIIIIKTSTNTEQFIRTIDPTCWDKTTSKTPPGNISAITSDGARLLRRSHRHVFVNIVIVVASVMSSSSPSSSSFSSSSSSLLQIQPGRRHEIISPHAEPCAFLLRQISQHPLQAEPPRQGITRGRELLCIFGVHGGNNERESKKRKEGPFFQLGGQKCWRCRRAFDACVLLCVIVCSWR